MTTTTTRRAWIIGGSVVAALFLAWGTFQIIGLLARETTTETRSFRADGLRLVDIRSPNGSVEVLGGNEDEVTLTARITHGLRRTEHKATVEGTTLRVRSQCPVFTTWCRVEYRLSVPAQLAVTASIDNGRLIVRDLSGAVRADGDNGLIELTRLGGAIQVSNDNGRVQSSGLRSDRVVVSTRNGPVRLSFGEPPEHVEARSANGPVEVVLPETADAYRVDLDTDNGSTDVGVRADPSSARSIVASTNNGDVTVRYPSG